MEILRGRCLIVMTDIMQLKIVWLISFHFSGIMIYAYSAFSKASVNKCRHVFVKMIQFS